MVQMSKSGCKENPLLKAGHPPAVKAGGKRVVKRNLEDSSSHGTADKVTKSPDKPRSLATANRMQQVSILLAGSLEKFGHDFPETPVSVRHSKVRPAMEKPHHSPRAFPIQQPRKCWIGTLYVQICPEGDQSAYCMLRCPEGDQCEVKCERQTGSVRDVRGLTCCLWRVNV